MYPLWNVRRLWTSKVNWHYFGIPPARWWGPFPGYLWPEKSPQDCAQHPWLEESEAAQSFPRSNGHDLILLRDRKLPLTPVMQFYPCAEDNLAVTLTPQLWCRYGKSTHSQSNFHSLSTWPMHWALIWVNESFSCRKGNENVHSLCLRGGRCLQQLNILMGETHLNKGAKYISLGKFYWGH